jgi:hypothetical protein
VNCAALSSPVVLVNPANVAVGRPASGSNQSLAESVRRLGVLEPVVLRTTPDGPVVLDGSRRIEAARSAGVPAVRAIVEHDVPRDEFLLRRGARVVHARRPAASERANVLWSCLRECGPDVGKDLGVAYRRLEEEARLGRLPKPVLDAWRRRKLSRSQVRQLVGLPLKRVKRVGKLAARHGPLTDARFCNAAGLPIPRPRAKAVVLRTDRIVVRIEANPDAGLDDLIVALRKAWRSHRLSQTDTRFTSTPADARESEPSPPKRETHVETEAMESENACSQPDDPVEFAVRGPPNPFRRRY